MPDAAWAVSGHPPSPIHGTRQIARHSASICPAHTGAKAKSDAGYLSWAAGRRKLQRKQKSATSRLSARKAPSPLPRVAWRRTPGLRKAAVPRHFGRQPGKSPFAETAWWSWQDSNGQPDRLWAKLRHGRSREMRQLQALREIGSKASPGNNSPARMYRFNIASEAGRSAP
jgi:hypothetical protein